ncbi:MAG: HAD-IIA family hydrolase [Chloroflexi bacterium]|nr:HAD-IIA family hydrolase [Chloroflexota bacterium]MBK8931751.1 HAD-IIA family hydrolase [Chloroflexota bacterium]
MKPYDAYIFDLDGTVYLGEAMLPTALETITHLRSLGKRTVFLSNNPTHTREEYAAKLTRLGLPTPANDVINSSYVMADFLTKQMPGAKLFVVGEESLCEELRRAGFQLTDNALEVDAVIASFDRTFVYRKLQIAFDAIRHGARFFATNADRYCPVPGGGEPDAAAMIAAIEACTGTQVEAIVGKPSHHMAEAILTLLELSPDRCIMTGDRLETDVQMGLDAGMAGTLTLTGATTEAVLAQSTIKPTYVIRQLSDLLP